jgi:RNA polymerase sigma-70 factor (ECF subfamily)
MPHHKSLKELEHDLISSFMNGCTIAFSELYRMHHATVVSLVNQQVRCAATADEIAQEVFLKAHRFRETYKPGSGFRAWIRAIARNTSLDWLRKNGSDPVRKDGVLSPEDFASDAPCAESIIIRKSERKRLRQVLRNLTRAQRRVLWMSIVGQKPYQEIARHLGVSIASVKCLAYRARAVLAESMIVPAMA